MRTKNLPLDCHVYVPLRKKSSLVLVFFVSYWLTLPMCRNQSVSAERLIQKTHRPLTTISFKITVNNSLKYLPLLAYKKNFAEFLYIFNSLAKILKKIEDHTFLMRTGCKQTACISVNFSSFSPTTRNFSCITS